MKNGTRKDSGLWSGKPGLTQDTKMMTSSETLDPQSALLFNAMQWNT